MLKNEFLFIGCTQRTGIADGGEIEFRPPELLPGFLLKINNKY